MNPRIQTLRAAHEDQSKTMLAGLFASSPVVPGERLANLGLYLDRQALTRLLFIDEIYRKIVDVPGAVLEFGSRWGNNLALFLNLRGIHEPYNWSRRIIGFDTFEGFPSVDAKDGDAEAVKPGAYAVVPEYRAHLEEVLARQDAGSPVAHIRKWDLVTGDVCQTVPEFLAGQPGLTVALAYFDLDLYGPTKACLEAVAPRLTKGSVLVFDEFTHPGFPGEAVAVLETLGVAKIRLRRSSYSSVGAYCVVD